MPLSVPRGVYHYGGDKVVHGLYDIESLLQEKRRAIRVGEKICHRFQLCVVGDVDQGKTSTVRSLTGQVFRKELPNTEGVDVRRLASVVHADRAWTVVCGSEAASAAAESGEVESLLAEHVAGECARRAREQPAARLRYAYALLIALSLAAGPLSLATTGYTTLAAVANVTCACLALGVTCTSVRLALSFTNVSVLLLIAPPLGFGCGNSGGTAAAFECAAAFGFSSASHFALGFLTGFGFGPGLTTGAMLMRSPEALHDARRRLVQVHFGNGDALGHILAVALTVASCCTALLLTTFWKRSQSIPSSAPLSKPSSWASPLASWSGSGGMMCFAVAAVAAVAAAGYFRLWLSHVLQLCFSHAFWWFAASFFVGAVTLAGVVAGRRGGAAVAPVAIAPWQVVVNVYAYFLPGVAASAIALWLAGWTPDGPTDAAAKLCLGYGLSKLSAAFDYLRDVAPPAASSVAAAEGPGRSSSATVTSSSSSAPPRTSAQQLSASAVEPQSGDASSAASTASAAATVASSNVAECDGCLSPASPLASFRMVIRDFAGHSVYRPMQQAFMPRCSFYLVVFSWLDADRDVDDCAARLTAWLSLVLAHVGAATAAETGSGAATSVVEAKAAGTAVAADGSVLLVGTHAADVVESRRRELDMRLQSAVPPKALRLLRCRSADELVFSIENSLGPDEPGVAELRRVLSAEARLKALAFFPRSIPLRWWEWLGRVAAAAAPADSCGRCRAGPFESADRLYAEWRRTARDLHQVDVLRQDFDEMIAFFHDIGEVYVVRAPTAAAATSVVSSLPGGAADDDGGGGGSAAYVFLDVQFIADAAAAVAAGEPLGAQPPGLREEWRRLSTLGVCRLSFLRRIVDDKLIGAGRQPTTIESFAVLASLLERLDLLHRIEAAVPPPPPVAAAIAAVPRSGDRRQEAAAPATGDLFVFVPERLPLAAADQLWAPAKPCDQQVDVYVRFEAFTADQLLYRLLCRCAAGCAFDGGCGLSLYRNAAEFQTSGGVFLMRVRPGCRNSVVVVSVRAQTYEHCAAIIRLVSDAVREIVDRDFPYLTWSLNVLCPLDGHTDTSPGYRDTGGLHLINSTVAFANPDAKVIVYCRGRPLVIHRYKVVIQKLYHRPSLNSVVAEDVVEKLVVEQLNTDDFKRLSSALGLNRIEVNNIMAANSHSSRDGRLETMRLWISRKGEDATYAALIQALEAKELREAASYVCLLLEEDEMSGQYTLRSGSFSQPQPQTHSFYSTSSPSLGVTERHDRRHCRRHGGDGSDSSDEPMRPLPQSVGSSASASDIVVGVQAYDAGSMATTGDGELTDYAENNDDR